MTRKIFAGLALLCWIAGLNPAIAQTSPNWTYGFVPSVAQWNAIFSSKQDYLGAPPLLTTGGTMTGKLVTSASTTSRAGFGLLPGTAPTSPIDGDLWTTTSSIFARINGATVDLINNACPLCAKTNVSNSFTADQNFDSTTDIAIPSPIAYAGSIKTLGGITATKGIYGMGGYLYLGTGANAGGLLGSGAVVIGMIGGDASSAGCGGSAVDFDNGIGQIQTQTIGNASLVNNCLLAGMTTYLSTPTWKSNEGRFFYYSGNPATHGATTSIIGSLDYAQGFRVNLNTTLVFANLAAPITGASLQLTQADGTKNRVQMDSYGAANFISGVRSNGNKASPTALVVNDEIVSVDAYGRGSAAILGPAGHIGLYAGGAWGTDTPTYADICTTPTGSATCLSRFRITKEGEVAMGVATPPASTNIGFSMAGPTSGTNGGTYIAGAIGFGGSLSWAIGGASALIGDAGPIDTTMVFKNTLAAYRFSGLTAGIFASSSNGTISISSTVGSGSVVLASGPTISGLTVTGSFTATGLVGNAALANSSFTINGTSISLGGTATIAAAASGVVVGTTTVTGGSTATNDLFFNNAGVLGRIASANSGALVTSAGGVPSVSTTLPNMALGTPLSVTLTNGTGLPTTGLTGTLQPAQEPAHTGDVTNTAGSLVLAIGATKVTSAMLNADVFSTAHSWAGQQTFTAPILGTPASGVATNLTGLPISTGLTGAGTGVLTALGVNVGSAGAFVTFNGAIGTPSSGVGTNITNVNAATLGGATFAAPGAIGGGTPGTAAFTTLTASGVTTITNATNITLPAPYLFNTGALQVAGGASIQGDVQIKGGSSAEAFVGIGDGTRTVVDVNLNSTATGTGCGGVVDFDAVGTQWQAVGSWSSIHNSACDLTPTWRANQGVWKFNNGSSTDVSFQISGSSSTNTGINITPAAAASGVDIAAISTGSNENLTINAKGTGTVTIGNGSTGSVTVNPALAATNGIVGVTNASDAAAGRVGQTFYATAGNNTIAFTVTIASPAVVTQAGHGYSNTGTAAFVATTTGALPTGLVAGTVYWVIPGTVSGSTFQVATSIANAFAGTAVNTSGSQSGTHTGKSSIGLTASTSGTVAAIQLTAGDWDIYTNGVHDVQNTTTVTQEITNASLTLGGDFLNVGALQVSFPSTGSQNAVPVAPFRVSTSSTQIVYLQAFDVFSVSTARFAGYLTARRVR